MSPPLMKTEQNRAIRVEDLTEVVVFRSRFRQAKQRLVPRKAASDIGYSNNGPCASYGDLLRRGPCRNCLDAIVAQRCPRNNQRGPSA